MAPLALLLAAFPALAQSDVSPLNKFAWSENIGWTNWRDAGPPQGQRGWEFLPSRDAPLFARGFVWTENTGWINLGDGAPANGQFYSNTSAADFGVNVDFNDFEFGGFAWGENVGWINFDAGRLTTPFRVARYDPIARRFRGFVWSENIGWINLDHGVSYIGILCPADFDDGTGTGTPDGGITLDDLLYYLDLYAAGEVRADLDDGTGSGARDGGVTIEDLLYFLARYEAGC
jgi:hypothetical protein